MLSYYISNSSIVQKMDCHDIHKRRNIIKIRKIFTKVVIEITVEVRKSNFVLQTHSVNGRFNGDTIRFNNRFFSSIAYLKFAYSKFWDDTNQSI